MWTNRLTPEQADLVRALAARAEAADGIDPLNEEARFALRDGAGEHVLLTGVPGTVSGYLQWQPAYGTAQLVVDPAQRRRGLGTSLLAVLDDRPAPETGGAGGEVSGIWAFGDLAPARGFALANHLSPSRSLLIMDRSLAGIMAPDVPDGLSLRGYTAADAGQLLAVNAAAFAHHPEQGVLDAAGLAARMAEPWFDPAGLILGFDAEGLAGFHWTKQVEGTGEVYVIGVAPRTQGRGYGKVLLQAGLAHLRSTGSDRVLLYVDSAEEVAVRMYESAGFGVARRDVLYAPEDQEQP
ncbi:MAG TPA: mycothiol synthase [Propionicimonas sp.]|uniref:mycothiol synthase n=1 Tax=Propionicimonas sp. TaxID=1955623 RepID=UPI002F42CEA0